MKSYLKSTFIAVLAAVFTFDIVFWILTYGVTLPSTVTLLAIVSVSIALILISQAVFTLVWMLYAWEDPQYVSLHTSPRTFLEPLAPFSVLIPARHEEDVIADTIKAFDRTDYPDHLKEVLVLCREDDVETIREVERTLKLIGKPNLKLVTFNSSPINKPHALNQGLKVATHPVIAVFDAEDAPHPDIFNVANTVMAEERADVVQSGVQLMNYDSRWFSLLNVLEYFFWFKSGLHFFSRVGAVTPLGGNTVFFKKVWLDQIGGWDEACLTEDADIAIRLTLAGAMFKIVYDERHVTREETPPSVSSFVKQRTRWNQGFLQIFLKGDWTQLPLLRQKLIITYVLLSPVIQALLIVFIPIGISIAFLLKLPMPVTLLSFIPFYLFGLQMLVYIVGFYTFTKAYRFDFPLLTPLKVLATFYVYQLLLAFSSFRAVYRIIGGRAGWEKTPHTNAHREHAELSFAKEYV